MLSGGARSQRHNYLKIPTISPPKNGKWKVPKAKELLEN